MFGGANSVIQGLNEEDCQPENNVCENVLLYIIAYVDRNGITLLEFIQTYSCAYRKQCMETVFWVFFPVTTGKFLIIVNKFE